LLQVISFRPSCYEAFWARAKARRELNELTGALADLREAIKLSPKNMELHRFTMQVKSEMEARPNINNNNNGIPQASQELQTGVNVIKLFSSSSMTKRSNKLEQRILKGEVSLYR